jgi:RNA polymerase sigma-B factor
MRAAHEHDERDERDERDVQYQREHDDAVDPYAELLRRFRQTGDRHLRNRVVDEHRWLAVSIAREYRAGRESLDDLIQVACVALLKAAERFDPDYGAQFRSFAAVTVRGELRRYFRDATWAVHVPRRLQELRLEIRAANELLTERLRRSPRVDEVAEYLHIQDDEVIEAIAADQCYRAAPIEHGPTAVVESVGRDDTAFGVVESSAAFEQLTAQLSARLRRIVEMRFIEERTQSDIAAELGVSQVQISRLLRQALDELRASAGPRPVRIA